MRTKPIIVGAVVSVLLSTAILFITARPSPSPITVRHLKSVQSGDWLNIIFEITNDTPHPYIFVPLAVEVRNGAAWDEFYKFPYAIAQHPPTVEPYELTSYEWDATDLKAGSRFRLRLSASESLTGLKGRFAFLEWSLVNHKNLLLPLNPSYTNFSFGRTMQIVSEEFVEPDSNHADQGALEK